MSAYSRGSRGAATPVDRTAPPAPGLPRPFDFPRIERFTLSNGLDVLFARTEGLPVTTMSLLLPGGGTREPAEQAGLASLTSGLLESGTTRRSAAEIAEALEALGINLNVGTSWEVSFLDLTTLSSRLEPAAGVLAELVREPSFPLEEVERLRHEQTASILQRRAEPRGLANEIAARALYASESPYARPLNGVKRTVQSLVRADVEGFHASHYSPGGAMLLVAGNLSPEEATSVAEQEFGDWVGGRVERVRVSTEPQARHRRLVIVDRPGSVQSEIRIGHVGVARETPDYFPIVVMNTILGGAFSSRLNMNLREKHGFTYGVHSAFSMRRHPGPFIVSTAVQTEVTSRAVEEILKELERIREAPVTEREIEDARNYVAGVFPLRLQTTDGVASRLAELAIHRLPLDYFDSYRDRVLAVTPDEVLDAAREHIRPQELVVVLTGDSAAIRDSVEALGIAEVEIVKPEELD